LILNVASVDSSLADEMGDVWLQRAAVSAAVPTLLSSPGRVSINGKLLTSDYSCGLVGSRAAAQAQTGGEAGQGGVVPLDTIARHQSATCGLGNGLALSKGCHYI